MHRRARPGGFVAAARRGARGRARAPARRAVIARHARRGGTRPELLAYFSSEGDAAAQALGLADPARRIAVSGAEPVPDTDWEQEWRSGLAPRRIAGLWIRPSFCAASGEPELVIDPQQAFGSGEHASTRLALAAPARLREAGRVGRRRGHGQRHSRAGGAARRRRARRSASTPIRSRRERGREPRAQRAGRAALLRRARRARSERALRRGRREPVCSHELPAVSRWTRRTHAPGARAVGPARERARAPHAALPGAGWVCARELSEVQSGETWIARLLVHADAR